jgi:hypothetical protein
MKDQPKLNDPEKIRLRNIIDMGLAFSAMIRLFDNGSKEKFRKKCLLRQTRYLKQSLKKVLLISIQTFVTGELIKYT